MIVRVGINGFGRIGRTFVRRALERLGEDHHRGNDRPPV
jgi:glyceraldehyde-3-phosphate dehydrogenase/erythrose-4-phosphate dehydrogenase